MILQANRGVVRLPAARAGRAVALLALALATAVHPGSAEPIALFVAGPPSHGPGEHAFEAGAEMLAGAINSSGLALRADLVRGWPDEDVLARATTLILYSDGLEAHVARAPEATRQLRRHLEAKRGLSVLHFALEPSPGELADLLLDAVGGRFVVDHSVNPIWTMVEPRLAVHPVTRGVPPFSIEDEWYFHLLFRPEVVPVLEAVPPPSAVGENGPRSGNPTVRAAIARREPQTLAWVLETDGRRAFGFTGGHFHRNWSEAPFRQLVLNGIVWTAGVPVPPGGVPRSVAAFPRHATIDEAIARGDLDDVNRHLARDAARANHGASSRLSPLQQALRRNKPEVIEALLRAGADANAPDPAGRTPLHYAVLRGTVALVESLLAHRADPNRRDEQGWTPLHHAAARDRVDVARALLAGGADPGVLSELGGTPLHEAAASGGDAMVRLLLEAGTDPAVRSSTGASALDIAREFKNEAALSVLSPP